MTIIIKPIRLQPIPKPIIIRPTRSGPYPAIKAPIITEIPPLVAMYPKTVVTSQLKLGKTWTSS
ncbi:MAG: hypothetical protein ACTSR7_17920 [Promethearchaeota archaeon]